MNMSQHAMRLGIDLGGTKIEIIALDQRGQIHLRKRCPTPKHNDEQQRYRLILSCIQNLVESTEHKLSLFKLPLGIGIPGAVSLKTGLIKNANTTCLIGRPFSQDLSDLLNREVKLENDANCFALSEAIDGAGKDHNTVFSVILGTGVGAGIVINKQLLIGANAISGEWGHNALPWPDENDEPKQSCYCGLDGCIETYLSGPGFEKITQQQFNLSLSCHDIFLIKSGVDKSDINKNVIAKKAYDLYVLRLAKSLASIINVLDPNVIILGGGLSNVDSLYEDIPKQWGRFIFSDEVNTKLCKNQHGDSSGVRGAARL